jgi:thymidylate synthase
MTLPPCHYGFQVYTRELSYSERYKLWFSNNYETGMEYHEENIPDFDDEYYCPTPTRAISLMWNQRSVDTFLGLPFNIASYGLLLEIIAKEVNMVPDELIGNLGDVHLYSNHIDQAKEQIGREPMELPSLNIKLHFDNEPSFVPEQWLIDDFEILGYKSHPTIKAPLSN